jgi:hypothetical protein
MLLAHDALPGHDAFAKFRLPMNVVDAKVAGNTQACSRE